MHTCLCMCVYINIIHVYMLNVKLFIEEINEQSY